MSRSVLRHGEPSTACSNSLVIEERHVLIGARADFEDADREGRMRHGLAPILPKVASMAHLSGATGRPSRPCGRPTMTAPTVEVGGLIAIGCCPRHLCGGLVIGEQSTSHAVLDH